MVTRKTMDILDYTRIVFDKIQKFEPEYATKIFGYLLLQDHVEQEMAKLVSCPDHLLREVAFRAKMDLQRFAAAKPYILPLLPPMNHQPGLSRLSVISSSAPSSPASFQAFWEPQSTYNNANTDFMAMGYLDSVPELEKQTQLFSIENHVNDYFSLDGSTGLGNLSTAKPGRRFSSVSEFPVKTCHYFNKGFCKHGSSCRYYHGQLAPQRISLSQMYGNINNSIDEDEAVPPGPLAQLEAEIIELIKPRPRNNPMTIASLPTAYHEKYNKVLQAEGYLTESQRHGKSGYSLTKLLARLKHSIRLLDRPHGQHAVVLAEDAPKYEEKGEGGQTINAARQLYLTFPADSTFTEEDVANYFNNFGCVEDVRIPCQQKRMFGFVTFVDPQTVRTILEKGNPHYVRGSRVLVKPYKEKSRQDRNEPPVSYSQYVDMDSELTRRPRSCGNARFRRRQLFEEQERALEFQKRCLAELQFAQNPLSNSPHLGFSMGGLKASEDPFNFQPAESLNYTDDEDSDQGLNLPDNPFAFPRDSGITAVT